MAGQKEGRGRGGGAESVAGVRKIFACANCTMPRASAKRTEHGGISLTWSGLCCCFVFVGVQKILVTVDVLDEVNVDGVRLP